MLYVHKHSLAYVRRSCTENRSTSETAQSAATAAAIASRPIRQPVGRSKSSLSPSLFVYLQLYFEQ